LQPRPGRQLERDLSLLYRLALRMGSAGTSAELVRIVLDGLLEATRAEVGAVLAVRENRELDLLAYHHRDPAVQTYHKVSQFLSGEVLSTREAVLAEDVSRNEDLRQRESLAELRATSVICAPVVFGEKILGLIHLYCTSPPANATTTTDAKACGLDGDDLEFAVAVARQLGAALHQLQVQTELTVENRALRDQLRVESELVGESRSIHDIESQIGRVADTAATVLIRGESGVGKELVARAIHFSSPRKAGPFICLNCAALTETLLESELFGHERGAFTGATEKMVGKFEAADRGTIFLDEIGEMNLNTQSKFLRVLEGHPFERVGGNTPIKVSVRVVAATNQELEASGAGGGRSARTCFSGSRWWKSGCRRSGSGRTTCPCWPIIFCKRFVREMGRRIKAFTPAAQTKLREYHWPGNVRELRNVIERAVALSTGTVLDADDLWLSSLDAAGPSPLVEAAYRQLSLADLEKEHILRTLAHTDWNKSQAATILGIERSTLDRKIKGYDLQK